MFLTVFYAQLGVRAAQMLGKDGSSLNLCRTCLRLLSDTRCELQMHSDGSVYIWTLCLVPWALRTRHLLSDPLLFSRQQLQRQAPALCALRLLKTSPATHSEAIATPPLDGAPKQYSPKIQQLVNDIASLTLLEVSDLNELLKVCGELVKHQTWATVRPVR